MLFREGEGVANVFSLCERQMSTSFPLELSWDPEIDTPASVAVIGGGPSGVEAALYGRFLGYSVDLFETGKVGDSLLFWRDRSLQHSWREVATTLGMAALEAHGRQLPELDNIPTCEEYVDQYLLPLARCDLLHESVSVRTRVVSLSRFGCDGRDTEDLNRRAETEFRLLLSADQRGEYSQWFDLVFDCSGIDSVRRGLAPGGGRPAGWASAMDRVLVGKFDLLKKHAQSLAGNRVLLVGSQPCAIANALQWQQVSGQAGRLYWVIPKRLQSRSPWIDRVLEGDLLDEEDVAKAEHIVSNSDSANLVSMSAWGIESIHRSEDELTINLLVNEDETVEVKVDWIVNCGLHCSEPNYHHSLRLDSFAGDDVVRMEPHFYMLGDRAVSSEASRGTLRRCSFSEMKQQIRRIFGLVGGRADLDLYQSVRPQIWT